VSIGGEIKLHERYFLSSSNLYGLKPSLLICSDSGKNTDQFTLERFDNVNKTTDFVITSIS